MSEITLPVNHGKCEQLLSVPLENEIERIEYGDRINKIRKYADTTRQPLGLSYGHQFYWDFLLETCNPLDVERLRGDGRRIVERLKKAKCSFHLGELIDELGNKVCIEDFFITAHRLTCQWDKVDGKTYYQRNTKLGEHRRLIAIGTVNQESHSWLEHTLDKKKNRELMDALSLHLPQVTSITDVPFLGASGLEEETGVYKIGKEYRFLKNQDYKETAPLVGEEAKKAARLIVDMFEMGDVSWVDGSNESGLLSAIFNSCLGLGLDIRKGLCITSRDPGNGKGTLARRLLCLRPGGHARFDFSNGGPNEEINLHSALVGGGTGVYWEDVSTRNFSRAAEFSPFVKNMLSGCDSLKLKGLGDNHKTSFEGRQLLVVDGRGLVLTDDFVRRFTLLSFIRNNKKKNVSAEFADKDKKRIYSLVLGIVKGYIQERGAADCRTEQGFAHYCEDMVEWCGFAPVGESNTSLAVDLDKKEIEFNFLRALQEKGKLTTTQLVFWVNTDIRNGILARELCGVDTRYQVTKEGVNFFCQIKRDGVGRNCLRARLNSFKDSNIDGLRLRSEVSFEGARGKKNLWFTEVVEEKATNKEDILNSVLKTEKFIDLEPLNNSTPFIERIQPALIFSNVLDDVTELKRKADRCVTIFDVLRKYYPKIVNGKRNGDNYCCPFHDDSSPSFTVSNNMCNCHACGKGTDVIGLCATYYGLVPFGGSVIGKDYVDTLKRIEQDFSFKSISIDVVETRPSLYAGQDKDAALELFLQGAIFTCEGLEKGNRYLETRGLPKLDRQVFFYHPQQNCLFVQLFDLIADRRVKAVHRFYLDKNFDLKRDSSGKRIKKMLGSVKGHCALVRESETLNLYIAEGVETALAVSAYVDRGEIEEGVVIAALSSELIPSLKIPSKFNKITVMCDNDQVGIEAAFKLRNKTNPSIEFIMKQPKNSDFLDDFVENIKIL